MLRYIYCLIIMLLFAGCSTDTLDLKNPSEYDEETYFTTQKECQEVVIACYSCFTNRPFYARDWYYIFDLLADQAGKTEKLETGLAQLGDYTFQPDNEYIRFLWDGLFQMNMRALVALEKVGNWEPTLSSEADYKNILLGEAHFFHSWAYYYLTELFGDVPFHDSWESIKEEPTKGRTAYSEIQNSIESHLLEAINLLPETWSDENLGRITKSAARAHLGKLYLTQGNNDKAIEYLSAINGFELASDYYNLFTRGNHTSKEIIMQVVHKFWGWGDGNSYYMFGGKESWGGKAVNCARHIEYGFNDWHNVYVTNNGVSKFTYQLNGKSYLDPRNQLIVYGDGTIGDGDFVSGPFEYQPYNGTLASGYQWKKYCYYETEALMNMDDGDYSSIIVRLADIKLLLAEAYVAKGDYAKATELINEVRARVSAEPYNTLTASNAFEALKRERFIELFGEQHYWMDLVRWDRLGKLNMLDEIKGNDAKFKKFPIPSTEKDTNSLIEVSNGWN